MCKNCILKLWKVYLIVVGFPLFFFFDIRYLSAAKKYMFSALETKGYLCKKYIDSALENGMVSMQNLNS